MLFALVDGAAILVMADKKFLKQTCGYLLDRPVQFGVSRRICVNNEIPEPSTGKLPGCVGSERYS